MVAIYSLRSLLSFAVAGLYIIGPVASKLEQRSTHLHPRDASTQTSGGTNNEGEAHGAIVAPPGADFANIPVGTKGETIAAYWSSSPANSTATQAFIMIHGKLRDGDAYWTTMDTVLNNAVKSKITGARQDSIIVAPQFFSTIYNLGQYADSDLAWADVNAWQAGDPATHPKSTTLTSFDALDALVEEFSNASKYPAMKNITIVGHGGGGQLIQRYAMVAENPPSNVHIRYIHGDPSSCGYFTKDRPQKMANGVALPTISSCSLYDTWRYGLTNFTGTAQGLLSAQQYFKQYISRDVISIVGYQDTQADGDQYCMAKIQGGTARRDRNLAWWQYVNTLAKTNEDLTGFPATFGNLPDWSNISGNAIKMQLIVVEDADHDAALVFSSAEGQAALFSTATMPTGWRPAGWTSKAKSSTTTSKSTPGASSTTGNGTTTSSALSSLSFSTTICALVVSATLSFSILI